MSYMTAKASTIRCTTETCDSSSDPEMLKPQIISSTQEFYNFLRGYEEYILRRLTKISMAITT